MKKFPLLVLAGLLVGFWRPAGVQVWTFDGDFKLVSNPHGVVVDPAGKIWIGPYGRSDTISVAGADVYLSSILVFNPDGTPASFSPIRTITVDGVIDTMRNRCRGVSLDQNGNILYSAFDTLYRINYQTGAGMNKVIPLANKAITEAGVDSSGFLYVGHVVPGGAPMYIYDTDFQLYGFVQDSSYTITRTIVTSPDGKDLYVGSIYPGDGVEHWHSDAGPDGDYVWVKNFGNVVVNDTIVGGMWGQCLDWDNSGLLWVGTYWDVGPNDFRGWYGLDPVRDWAIVDNVGVPGGKPTAGVNLPARADSIFAPRGAAWSADGKTMYTADFDGNVIKRWTNPNPIISSVSSRGPRVARDFALYQNYPNPFNPTTTIPFTLSKSGFVELKVFNIMGREVTTLISKPMVAGSYHTAFDGSGLASGIYYYRLTLDGQLLTKQMILVK